MSVCGTNARYVGGCRCSDCRRAHRLYNAAWTARAPENHRRRPYGPPRCGTNSAYSHGCRCEACRAAHAVYNARWKRRRRIEAWRAYRRRRFSIDDALRLGGCSGNELARRLGTTHGQVSKWRQRGLPPGPADRVAVAIGLHPALVWPDWLE
jgi:hypothetical protein